MPRSVRQRSEGRDQQRQLLINQMDWLYLHANVLTCFYSDMTKTLLPIIHNRAYPNRPIFLNIFRLQLLTQLKNSIMCQLFELTHTTMSSQDC